MCTFYLEQISKLENLYANLILRQNQLNLLSKFLKIKSIKSKLTRKQTTKT